MLSLIHMLAARACHADTLRRALTGDDEARRLLSLLGITPLDLQAIDHGRITRRKAALNEQEESTADAIDRALLWISTTPPDALSKMDAHYKALLEQSTASINELRQRLQAEIMAHDATRLRADLAESASEHGPLTDLLLITGRKVGAFCLPKAPEECRYGVSVEGYLHTHGATPREALIRMRDQVRERLAQTAAPTQTPPEEVIVLGPWRNKNGVMRREKLAGSWEGFAFMHTYPATPNGAWSCIRPERAHEADQTYEDIGGMHAADDWARKTYALIDAEPGSLSGTLSAWHASYGRYHEAKWSGGFILIDDNREGLLACPGWQLVAATPTHPKGTTIAEGPQTGEEGKRYALAAAHALGLTGGDE